MYIVCLIIWYEIYVASNLSVCKLVQSELAVVAEESRTVRPGPPERSIVCLYVMFAQVLLVLEHPMAHLTRHSLAGKVHVADVLAQVARVAEHFEAEVAAARLHALPLPPGPCGHKSASEQGSTPQLSRHSCAHQAPPPTTYTPL